MFSMWLLHGWQVVLFVFFCCWTHWNHGRWRFCLQPWNCFFFCGPAMEGRQCLVLSVGESVCFVGHWRELISVFGWILPLLISCSVFFLAFVFFLPVLIFFLSLLSLVWLYNYLCSFCSLSVKITAWWDLKWSLTGTVGVGFLHSMSPEWQ